MVRRLLDSLLALLARLAVGLATRQVEVVGRERIPDEGPILVVANHFNGFVDPLVVVVTLGRAPRFVAKATLWKILVARPFLRLAGVIPVHRAVDSGAGEANRGAFDAAEAALRRADTVAIFPEGTTHDDPRLAPMRTGAARIALGARAAGAHGLRIVPIGVLFEDKVVLRTRVLVRVGRPIDLDAAIPASIDEADRDAVRELTGIIGERLREVSPDYADRWEHAELATAAEVALRPEPRRRRPTVELSEREALAQAMATGDGVDAVRAATQRYAAHLHLLDVDDGDLLAEGGIVGWARRLVRVGVGFAFAYLLLVPALLPNIVPTALVAAAGTVPSQPVTKGSTRVLTGIVAYLATWIAWAFVVADTALPRLGWIAYQAAAILVALPILDGSIRWVRSTRSWFHLRERRGFVPDLLADRAALVAAVERASVKSRQ